MAPHTDKLVIVSQSNLAPRPSNSSAGYCKTCFSAAIMCAELYPKLQAMRENGELCDIKISLESSDFKTQAHRLVLAVKSNFFRSFFETEIEGKEYVFKKKFSADCIKDILDYMYEKNLEITADNVDGCLRLGALLELNEVMEGCCKFITEHFSVTNFLHYINLAKELNLNWLTERIFRFLEWNFLDLVFSDDFKFLKSFHLYRLICSKGLRIEREETLYLAAIKWYRYKPAGRKKSLDCILQHIHFLRMKPEFLKAIYPELVEELGLCKFKISSVKTIHQLSPNHVDIWTNGRRNYVSDFMYVFSSNEAEVDRYDEVQSKCVPCPQLHLPNADNGEPRYALQMDKSLFVLTSRKVLLLDWQRFEWNMIGKGTCIRDAGVCGNTSLGLIVVVGGKDSKALKTFDVKNRKWNTLSSMKTGRRGPGVVCHSKFLYIVGGYDVEKSAALSTMESLCLVTGEWSSLPSMRIPRCRLCCVIFKDKIVAMGGRDNVTNYVTVEMFNLMTKKWEAPKEHMNRAREEFCALVHEDMIFCFGGRGVQSVECYDPYESKPSKWTEIGTMGDDKQRSGMSCVTFSPPFDDAKRLADLMPAKDAQL